GLGGALPDQPASYFPTAVKRALADDQPGTLADPGSWRTRLSRNQATVGLHQSEIPRPGQEPGAGADHVRPGQPLPSPQATAPGRRQLRAVRNLRPVSSLCVRITDSPWSIAFPPCPPPVLAHRCSDTSQVLYDRPTPHRRACWTSGSRPSPTGPPHLSPTGVDGVSRFSRVEFPCMPGVFDCAESGRCSRGRIRRYCLPPC